MKTDMEFYDYARAHPGAFLRLFTDRVPEMALPVESPTLKALERRIDLRIDAGEEVWIIECHGYPDPGIERALFVKAVLAASQCERWGEVRTGILYTRTEIARVALPPRLGPDAHTPVDLQPVRVVLDALTPDELLGLSPRLFGLVPLGKVTREELIDRVVAWWGGVRNHLEGEAQQEELLEQFARFCTARFPEDRLNLIDQLLEAIVDIRDTQCGQDLIELGEKRGIELGEKRGIELGEKRGIELGERRGVERGLRVSITTVLESRFPVVPDDVASAIEACVDPERLMVLLRQAAIVPDLDAMRALL